MGKMSYECPQCFISLGEEVKVCVICGVCGNCTDLANTAEDTCAPCYAKVIIESLEKHLIPTTPKLDLHAIMSKGKFAIEQKTHGFSPPPIHPPAQCSDPSCWCRESRWYSTRPYDPTAMMTKVVSNPPLPAFEDVTNWEGTLVVEAVHPDGFSPGKYTQHIDLLVVHMSGGDGFPGPEKVAEILGIKADWVTNITMNTENQITVEYHVP